MLDLDLGHNQYNIYFSFDKNNYFLTNHTNKREKNMLLIHANSSWKYILIYI